MRAGVVCVALAAVASAFPTQPCTTKDLFVNGRLTHVDPDDRTFEGDVLKVFAVGDWGVDTMENSGSEWRGDFDVRTRNMTAAAMNQRATLSPPHMMLNLGDNFYTDGIRATTDPRWNTSLEHVFTEPQDVYWYSVLGNHDWDGNKEGEDENGTYAQVEYTERNAYNKWCMPSYNFTMSATVQPADGGAATRVKFTFIDTESLMMGGCRSRTSDTEPNRDEVNCKGADVPVYAEQMAWLEGEICGASDYDWNVVVGHHPIAAIGSMIRGYNPAVTDDWVDALNVTDGVKSLLKRKYVYDASFHNESLTSILTPLFSRCGVDVYYAGHEHMTAIVTHTNAATGHRLAVLTYGDSGKSNVRSELKEGDSKTACFLTGQCFASTETVQAAYGSEWAVVFKDYNGAFADVEYGKEYMQVHTVSSDGVLIHGVVMPKTVQKAVLDGDDDGSSDTVYIAVIVALAVLVVLLAGLAVFRFRATTPRPVEPTSDLQTDTKEAA